MTHAIQELLLLHFSTVPHANGKSLAQHCIDVGKLLEKLESRQCVVAAGYCHSLYGREATQFRGLSFQERPFIQSIIGSQAERLVYLNCIMTNFTFWMNFFSGAIETGEVFLLDRHTQLRESVTRTELCDLLCINFANMIDHIDPKNKKAFQWADLGSLIQFQKYLPENSRDILDEMLGTKK